MRCGFGAALSSKRQRSEEFRRGLHLLQLVNQRRLPRSYFLQRHHAAGPSQQGDATILWRSSTFRPIVEYPFEERRKKRGLANAVVELEVKYCFPLPCTVPGCRRPSRAVRGVDPRGP